MRVIFTSLLLIFGCGRPNQKPQDVAIDEKLKSAYFEKLTLAKETFDGVTGWPSSTDCDGTLWAGLAVVGGMDDIQINLAEYSPGEIHRRPAPSCWRDGKDYGSKTTISRDMLTGYMWALWKNRDRDALERLADYGERHNWKMGEPDADGRTRLTANGYGTLARMIKKLGGPTKYYIVAPYLFFSRGEDYEKHLNIIGILQNGQVDGGITKSALNVINDLANERPKDALFCAAQAKYETGEAWPCVNLLLGDYEYPSYVRGHENYKIVHWLLAAKILLGDSV